MVIVHYLLKCIRLLNYVLSASLIWEIKYFKKIFMYSMLMFTLVLLQKVVILSIFYFIV